MKCLMCIKKGSGSVEVDNKSYFFCKKHQEEVINGFNNLKQDPEALNKLKQTTIEDGKDENKEKAEEGNKELPQSNQTSDEA